MALPIPEEIISDIKQAADIVDVISESVVLKRTGKDLVGLCPFHSEKTPSFTVSPDKQIFHCFGCAAGGNVFSFVMRHQGLSFPEAVRLLAGRYGIELPRPEMTAAQRQRLTERERIVEINRQASQYFNRLLVESSAGRSARRYLKTDRDMSRQTVDAFQLGFAPPGWERLIGYFKKRRVSPEMLAKAGLTVPRQSGSGYYDRFRNRVIFPIHDGGGRVIGFGGRVMDDGLPKYLNSPETAVYNKRRCLYGLHQARQACRRRESVFIVEGYFDLLALHQNGIANVVATLGTALTAQHVQLLRGCVGHQGRMVLVFDSDEAGIKAAKRSIELFTQGHAEVCILILPTGHDPDTFVRENGAEAFNRAAETAIGAIPFLIESAVTRHGLSVQGKMRVVDDLMAPLAAVGDPVARGLYVKTLAERVDIGETAILQKLRQASPRSGGSRRETPGEKVPGDGRDRAANRIERQLVAMFLQYPAIIEEVDGQQLLAGMTDRRLSTLASMILENRGNRSATVSDLLDRITDPKMNALAAGLAIEEKKWTRAKCLTFIRQFQDHRLRQDDDLQRRIKEAEARNDTQLLARLLSEKLAQARQRRSEVQR